MSAKSRANTAEGTKDNLSHALKTRRELYWDEVKIEMFEDLRTQGELSLE